MFNRYLFNRTLYNRSAGKAYRFHPVLEAEYYQDSPQVNRSFIIGVGLAGGNVTGVAITASEVALVGERLEVRHDSTIPTATAAGYAAAAALSKARLDGRRARITIPPHCGLELWDVVSLADSPANQATSYRVVAYTLTLDFKQGKYEHDIRLAEV